MKITLEVVRQTLKEALGFDSFVASFITEVREDTKQPTAGITEDGRLGYNPEFVAQYVTCREDLFSLIFHELLHPMFGHFIHGSGDIENIAADAVINAVISTLYATHSHEGALFKKFYEPKGVQGLLRPMSRMRNGRYDRLYERLYNRYGQCQAADESLSTGELIQSLKILMDTQCVTIVLLGTHGGDGESKDVLGGLSQEVLGRIAEEIKRSAMEHCKGAGYSLDLMSLLMEALRTHLSIRKALLQKFATKRKVDKFKELFQARRITVSPIPIHPSKRDLVLIAAGFYPAYFHNTISNPRKRDRGLAIYLDVSGSVNEYLPKILGILRSLKKEVTTIFQFSNKVVEVAFPELLKGKIQTTYGTDFNCVAQSILERGFDKAVIITDGYATMESNFQEQLKERGLKTLTVLFDDAQTCEEFAPFGDVVQLEDITD